MTDPRYPPTIARLGRKTANMVSDKLKDVVDGLALLGGIAEDMGDPKVMEVAERFAACVSLAALDLWRTLPPEFLTDRAQLARDESDMLTVRKGEKTLVQLVLEVAQYAQDRTEQLAAQKKHGRKR